jgi:hypothetical protein
MMAILIGMDGEENQMLSGVPNQMNAVCRLDETATCEYVAAGTRGSM